MPHVRSVLLATVLAASVANGQASDSAWKETSGFIPVAFSFGGAISMGSYQAGVNWALSHFVSLTQEDTAYRRVKKLPRIEISSLSGASAGNINAILAGIEYCDTTSVRARPPQESLFWKMWVMSGWDDLMPPGGKLLSGDDPGIFSRTRLRAHIESFITRAMQRPSARAGCRIPIGVTVTKLDAQLEPAPGGLELLNQRFVVPFELIEHGNGLVFQQADTSAATDRALGSVILVGTPGQAWIPNPEIINVVQASAAFPVAFAPVTLNYHTPGCVRGIQAGCRKDSAAFIDGGVFDVVPLSTAARLHTIYEDSSIISRPWAKGSLPRILFVDVGLARGKLDRYRRSRPSPGVAPQAQGFDAIMRFLGGFVPAARHYERHVYGRTLDSLTPHISTRRALPAVSEHLGYFAGFFGRPFREVDFHAGIADGLYYLAKEVLCHPVRIKDKVPADASQLARDLNHMECVRRELAELVTAQLNIDWTGQKLIAHLLDRGDTSLAIARRITPNGTPDSERLGVLTAIANAEISTISPNPPPCKKRGGVVTLALCDDGFKLFLDSLHRDKADVASTFRAWAADATCKKPATDPERARCRAERDLATLVEDPEVQMHSYVGDALRRLRSVEESGEAAVPRIVTRFLEATYRSSDYRYRRGWECDPSSIPPYESYPAKAFSLLPYFIGTTAGIEGFQLGWQPTFSASSSLGLALPTTASWIRGLGATEKTHLYVTLAPTIVWRRTSVINQLGGGYRLARCVEGNCPGTDVPVAHGTWEWSAHFGSKLRASVFKHINPSDGRRKLAGSISVVDANGLLYWLLHR